MDPDAALAEMRELARKITANPNDDVDMWADMLAERVIALDEWITKGGFPPRRWQQRQPPPFGDEKTREGS